jgi:type II secretory pathway component PulF
MHIRTYRTRWSVVVGLLATLALAVAAGDASAQTLQIQTKRMNNQDWQQAQQYFKQRFRMGGYYSQRLGAKLNLE